MCFGVKINFTFNHLIEEEKNTILIVLNNLRCRPAGNAKIVNTHKFFCFIVSASLYHYYQDNNDH